MPGQYGLPMSSRDLRLKLIRADVGLSHPQGKNEMSAQVALHVAVTQHLRSSAQVKAPAKRRATCHLRVNYLRENMARVKAHKRA